MRLGHSKSYFYRIENKEINLTIENLLDILTVLNVSTAEFFYPSVDNYKTDVEFIDLAKGLSKEELQSLKTILKR